MNLNYLHLEQLISSWLLEDLGELGDITTQNIIKGDKKGKALVFAKEAGVIAGIPVVHTVFKKIDPTITVINKINDGLKVNKGDTILEIEGSLASILMGERLALNLLQRLSGIATKTKEFVEKINDLPTKIADTRKTTPGLRMLEKYAVRIGGGTNHRYALYDAVLIKDNHIKAAGSITEAVRLIRDNIAHTTKIEVETESLEQVEEAFKNNVDIIMLDNMPLTMMREARKIVSKRTLLEASGNVTLERIRDIALTGVDIISIGSLTHSVKSLDISLDLFQKKGEV